jgi:dienelactone hydrolase
VYYRLWPNVYANGLLFVPKRLADRPAPAVLCPHGHWPGGNTHPEVQKRCLVLAKMGYVVFSPTQRHYEDLPLGISHQTHMIWTNVRGVDYLQSLPQVDPRRIGCAGGSGGGLQTQMLVAVDPRIRAATIAGMTCDYREIVFPGGHHCGCNHFPNIMRHTDEPELSALGLPAAVQYLTMNDWTRTFDQANGAAGRTDCKYWPTPHSYDRPKRERTYGWMERWLRDKKPFAPVGEPAIETFDPTALAGLKADVPEDKGLAHLSKLVGERFAYKPPALRTRAQWQAYRRKMLAALPDLLGRPAAPKQGATRRVGVTEADGLIVERVLCPSEDGLAVPVVVLRKAGAKGPMPAVVICDDRGKSALLAETGPDSAKALARRGRLVAVCDARFVGELALASIAGQTKGLLTFRAASGVGEGKPGSFEAVWQRNALLWGRPLPGMAATDLRAVAGYVASRTDARPGGLALRARGKVAVAALLAAAAEPRITEVHADLQSRCFGKRNLPLVPFVLRHGDVLQWAALLADRQLTLRGVPKEAGETRWLRAAFQAAGNPKGLRELP